MFTAGVIGIGSFGKKRVETLLKLSSQISHIYIFDNDADRLTEFSPSQHNRVTVLQSEEALFSHPGIDLVFICTPNATHPAYCEAALKNGKHVSCCKPITSNITTAKKLVKLAKSHKKILAYGANHRYFPSVQEALRIVKNKELGSILSMHAAIGSTGERIQGSWFWQKAQSEGGTFIDHGHHLLDLAMLFCGNFENCYGHSSSRHWKEAEVEDYAVAIYEQPADEKNSGYEAVLRSSWRQAQGYVDIELWGEKGSLKLQVGQQETLQLATKAGLQNLDFSTYPKSSLEQEISAFLQDCSQPTTQNSWSAQLIQLTQMIDGFYRSQASAKRVKLKK